MLERIGNCRIVEEVASGGMAVVYRAIQDPLNRTVAIKALKTAASSEQQLVVRFEREAQSLANLQHENIIHVYDFYEERGALFIVMEYVEGIDLYDLLDRCGRLPYDVAAIVAMQVARALDYIHYRGIIHRDIKPANIMVSRQGGVKLMDFGIARDEVYDEDLTETGTGIGTPSYMSPEQILGDKLDPRSDLFSLGIVLYQMCTGRKPFVEDEQKSVMHQIRLEKFVSPRKLNPEIPRELERIMAKCMQKLPRDRYRSAQDLVMALERFLGKHVDMNYHARLVLFLRNQDIISQLEADEHLNPMLRGRTTSVVSQQHLVARQVIRRGILVQSVITCVLAFIVGLIHLAPVGASRSVQFMAPLPVHGYVRIVAHPWARIAVDGEEMAATPLAEPIELRSGPHEIVLSHDAFEPIRRLVDVPARGADQAVSLVVDVERVGKPRKGTR
jgi:serine/threonine-protein kinase